MSIQIPEIHKEFYNNYGYYISKGHKFGNNPKKYIEKYSSLIGKIIYQESEDIFSKDIKPKSDEYNESPSTGNQELLLHTDGFFREYSHKPEAVLLLCINPGKGVEGRTIISDIERTLEEYRTIYGEKDYKKLIKTRLYFDSIKLVFMFGNIETQIFQNFEGDYMDGKLFDNQFYSVMDFMERDTSLVNFQVLLNKNMKILSKLSKGDIICINNKTFAHGRTGPILKDRHFIRVQIR